MLPITHKGNHFWYKSPDDSYVPGDCALYAVVRFLHHAGQLGIVHKDLWKKSNQELRNILADQLSVGWDTNENNEKYRIPREWMSGVEIGILLFALDPVLNNYKYFRYL